MENRQPKNINHSRSGGHNVIKVVFASRKPEIRRMIIGYGLTPATNEADLWNKYTYVIKKFPQEALRQIALLHPDRKFILDFGMSEPNKEESLPKIINTKDIGEQIKMLHDTVKDKPEIKSGACGCSGADGGYSNCGGNATCSCNKSKLPSYSNADAATAKPVATTTTTTPSSPAVIINTTTVEPHKSMSDKMRDNAPLLLTAAVLLTAGVLLWKSNASPMKG